MKAATNTSYGPPSVINLTDVPAPELAAGELLVDVHYSSVNRTDCGFLRAKPFVTRFFTGLTKPKYLALGCEFAGEVSKVGARVKDFRVGDNVFGFDDERFGGHAQYKVISADKMVYKVPSSTDLRTAAISTEGAHYALFYVYKIRPQTGMKIFVHGASGAIGSAAVQLLKTYDVHVTASCPTMYRDKVKTLGGDELFDWQKRSLDSLDQSYDVFFDAVGKSSFAQARRILKPNGMYLSSELGRFGQNPLLSLVNPVQRMFTKRNCYFPLPKTRKRELITIAKHLEEGSFVPLLDKTFELNDIVAAYEYVESGQKLGNVAIKVQ